MNIRNANEQVNSREALLCRDDMDVDVDNASAALDALR
jgi:hypothetical protein